MGYSSSTAPTSSVSEERWVMSATGCEARTARSSALTLRSRPTCSGTIISGKMTVSRRATSGSTWICSGSRSSASWLSGSLASWVSGVSVWDAARSGTSSASASSIGLSRVSSFMVC